MDEALRDLILKLLEEHRIMTIATNRPDGYPQATTVGYGHDGLMIYFACGRNSQKARNIAADPRVSLTVDADVPDIMTIQGLSMAAKAEIVDDVDEIEKAFVCLAQKYAELNEMPRPDPAEVAVVRVSPEVVSVLDYSKGFGHTDLVEVSAYEIRETVGSPRHPWRSLN